MLIIGLTGSIGMGKSTVAAFFRTAGVEMLDADAVVHALYAGPAVEPIAAAFPGVVAGGVVDRAALSDVLKADPDKLPALEAIVHPLVRTAQRDFLAAQFAAGPQVCGLEIPLLFETGGDARVDVTVVVSAPEQVQADRVLQRPGMTPDKLDMIRARQMSDAQKRARADVVIDTGCPLSETQAQVDAVVRSLAGRQGSCVRTAWGIPSADEISQT